IRLVEQPQQLGAVRGEISMNLDVGPRLDRRVRHQVEPPATAKRLAQTGQKLLTTLALEVVAHEEQPHRSPAALQPRRRRQPPRPELEEASRGSGRKNPNP